MNSRVLPLLAIIVAVGIFFAYVSPAWSGKIATAKEAIAASDSALAAARTYVAEQNQLAAERDAIDIGNLELLTTFLPDSVDNVGLILDLNALAARSQLSLANIDVITNMPSSSRGGATGLGALPASGMNPVGSVDLSLSAIGTFAALQDFLAGVERSARLLDIRDLVVKGSDTNVYNYQMTLRLYWLR